MAIFFFLRKACSARRAPFEVRAVRVAGGKGEQPVTEVYIPDRGWLCGWMEAIDIQRFDQVTLGTSLLPRGRAETDLCQFPFALVGSRQDSVHQSSLGWIGVPSSWGRERGLLVKASLPTPYPAWEAS